MVLENLYWLQVIRVWYLKTTLDSWYFRQRKQLVFKFYEIRSSYKLPLGPNQLSEEEPVGLILDTMDSNMSTEFLYGTLPLTC